MPLTDDGCWLSETERPGLEQRIRVLEMLYAGRSEYQEIQVVVTAPFGRALLLDGILQTSETDEFLYHEMLVHPALVSLAQPRRVLIIGGGDGGCLRRVLEHPVQEVVQVELDSQVVAVSRRYLPSISAGAFDDPRVRVIYGDGIAYVAEGNERFDAIIVDSTDPAGPSLGLFSADFYCHAASLLSENGLLVSQTGSPLYMMPEFLNAYRNLRRAFASVRPCLALVPSYPGAWWTFCVAGQGAATLDLTREEIERRTRERGLKLRYYSPEIHFASVTLPPFLAAVLASPQTFPPESAYPVLYPAT